MNEELQKALTAFAQEALTSYQQGKDFVLAEAPDVIQQLIRWKFWKAVARAAWGLVVIGVALFLWGKVARSEWWKDALHDGELELIVGLGPIIMGIIGLVIAFDNGTVALQIYLAPKVWLLEWAMRQVK